MKKIKPMLALLAFLPAFAVSPLPAADQEGERKMCQDCPMCQEKMKGMEKMKDLPEGKLIPQMEHMRKMQEMMQEKMQRLMEEKTQGMEPRQLLERVQRERREPVAGEPMGWPRGAMERRPGRGPEMPAGLMEPPDVKRRLAEADLEATVQQYGKVRHMLEGTETELRLLEQTDGQEKEIQLLSKRLAALEKLAAELRAKAEACCEMDENQDQAEQPGAHDHGDKHRDGAKQVQPEHSEEDKPAVEPHH